MNRQLKGNLYLFMTAVIWGTSFVAQKLGMNYLGPLTFGAVRFLLGAAALVPVILVFHVLNKEHPQDKKDTKYKKYKGKDLLTGGILCGAAVFLGATAQQWGIVYTTAGKAAFITTLYLVLVPLLGIFLRKKVNRLTWLGVGLAVIGLYLLTVKEGFTVQKGDAIVLLGTLFWALQIIIVDIYVDKADALKLSFVQFVTVGLFSAVAAAFFEKPDFADILACAAPIMYSGVLVVGGAYTLQIVGQQYTKPTVAAIILSMESVFAAASGALFLGESMGARELLGCLLMFAAVTAAQVKTQAPAAAPGPAEEA